jgi:hypothetical protein
VAGLILNRLDVGIFGFWRSGATSYFPSFPELAITLGIPAAAGLIFFALVERFRVFEMGPALQPEEPVSCTRFEKLTGVWSHVRIDSAERWSLMAVFVIPIAALLYGSGSETDEEMSVRPPLAVDATRSVLRIDANRDGAGVVFEHAEHQQRLGGETSCATCHHLNLPGDQATSCHVCHRSVRSAVSVFDHADHQGWVAARDGLSANRTCAVCHPSDGPREGATASACGSCHASDMAIPAERRLGPAPSYPDALHGSCAACHQERAGEAGRPHLGECRTCHD